MYRALAAEWKGIALLAVVLAVAAAFVSTMIHPPWNERVLASIAEEHGNVVQGVRAQPAPHIAQR